MYKIGYTPEAEKNLEDLPKRDSAAVAKRIKALAIDPRPHGTVSLKGSLAGLQRIRVGDYRVIYQIKESKLLVLVVKVARRDQVYSR
jgi:mRNA interferase RelE/StbE